MDKNSQSANNISEPALCAACLTFYGNPQFQSLCFKCYKEATAREAAKPQQRLPEAPLVQPPAPEEAPAAPAKQADKSKCWSCAKRAGSLGYECRCGFVFCSRHRMPESHECDFDFVADGKQQLAKNNPLIQNDKLERI